MIHHLPEKLLKADSFDLEQKAHDEKRFIGEGVHHENLKHGHEHHLIAKHSSRAQSI